MALPKLDLITYTLELPSTDQKIIYRPFTVKEEKMLLIAQESDSGDDIWNVMKQVVNNCVQTKIDVDSLATFDIEFIFMNLRAKSVGEEITFLLKHKDGINSKGEACEHSQAVKISVDDIKVHKNPNHKTDIKIKDNIGVKMKYPNYETMERVKSKSSNAIDTQFELIYEMVEFIYDNNGIYNKEDHTREEIIEWLYSMTESQLENFKTFFDTMPTLKHVITYHCSKCGCEEVKTIQGFQNFFL